MGLQCLLRSLGKRTAHLHRSFRRAGCWGDVGDSGALRGACRQAGATPSVPTNFLDDIQRRLASTKAGADAIPFEVSYDDAREAQKRFHSRHFFQAPPLAPYKTRDTFLPFWGLNVTVETDLHSVDVGVDRVVMGRDKRLQTVTKWQNVWIGRRLPLVCYTEEDENMQVPAGRKYLIGDVRRLRPGTDLRRARPLSRRMMDSQLGGTRRVGAFEVSARDAVLSVQAWLRSQEEQRCEKFATGLIAGTFDRLNVNMNTQIVEARQRPFYVPVYVFSHRYTVSLGLEAKIRTFVSGYDVAKVSGTRVLDPIKVAAATGSVVGASALLLGTASLSSPLELGFAYVVLPAIASGYAALYYPVALDLWRKLLARWRSQLEDLLSRTVQQRATYDWQQQRSHGASGGGKRQQQRPWSQSEEQQGTSMDPLGLYSKLGVDRTASMDEIKAAFRGLALKYHPDRVSDPAEKELIAAKFKEVSHAYQVLRNEHRRAAYDATGRVD